MTDTAPIEHQHKPSRFLQVASKASIVLTIVALIATGAVLAIVAIHESDRATYWRGLFIEQCIENAACDVEEEIEAGPPPAGPAGEPGVPGPTGPQGPSGADGAPGPSGAAGEDGDDGSAGESGAPGAPGLTGATGSAGEPGAAGASGSNGTDGAPGPAGPAGPAGANGADGRGIASLMCGEDGRWTVTYTDGSSSDAGVCRTDPAPTTDPEPSDPPIIELP